MLNIEAIYQRAEDIMTPVHEIPYEPGYRLNHGKRVEALCMQIVEAEQLDVNRECLAIGARLHDIGKGDDKFEPHGSRGARWVRERFADLMPADALEQVAEIVAHHYERPKSKWYTGKEKPIWNTEILVVQDADVLDHFGMSGIWISLRWSAHHGRSPTETKENWFDSERKINWRIEARKSLNFDTSRHMLEARIAEMDAFFHRLA